jgi:hypothetical protein
VVGEGEAVEEGDEMLTCRDCNNEFAFTVGEQQFFKEKGFDNKPTRCGDCKVRVCASPHARTCLYSAWLLERLALRSWL